MMLVRVTDQATDFLRLIERYGLVPGVRLHVVARDEQADTVEISSDGADPVSLGYRAASKIQVSPDRVG
jgi:Fe2+ transport system protein FeoA